MACPSLRWFTPLEAYGSPVFALPKLLISILTMVDEVEEGIATGMKGGAIEILQR